MEYCEWIRELIEGKRIRYGNGYKIYYPDKTITEDITLPDESFYIVDEKKFEDMLYNDCSNKIIDFSKSDCNRNVYAVALVIDLEVGQFSISLNTYNSFIKTVSERYLHYPQDKLNGLCGVKYNPGDFSYKFFDDLLNNPELKEIMDAYYCINTKHTISNVSKPIVFKDVFFDNSLILIGINVINRLKNVFKKLDQTFDFIAFVSLHDVDIETIISLMKRTVPQNRLKAILNVK